RLTHQPTISNRQTYSKPASSGRLSVPVLLRPLLPKNSRAAWWRVSLRSPKVDCRETRRRCASGDHADNQKHLEKYTRPEPDALVFTTPTGTPLRHNNFRRRQCVPAIAAASLTGIHFHDLRHTGNALTAGTERRSAS